MAEAALKMGYVVPFAQPVPDCGKIALMPDMHSSLAVGVTLYNINGDWTTWHVAPLEF